MSLKDGDPSAETDHHRKVETVSPSVLDLSLNVLEGRRSISSNRSSSQSRNSFSFCSWPVPKCPWRMEIHQQQQIIIAKYKYFFLMFSTCPSICLKDEHPSLGTVHHLNVETIFGLPLSVDFLEGFGDLSSNRLSWQMRNVQRLVEVTMPTHAITLTTCKINLPLQTKLQRVPLEVFGNWLILTLHDNT